MGRLNIRDFSTADRIVDILTGFRAKMGCEDFPIATVVAKIHLGYAELNALGLIGVPNPTFFDIPIQIVHQNNYISIESHG